MTVVLISLQEKLENLGLKLVHYALLEEGFQSTLLYMPTLTADAGTAEVEAICDFVAAKAPSFIGMSLMTREFLQAQMLSARLRERLPDIPIVWGGVHPTIAPEDCVDHADYVCVGEGERVTVEIARRLAAGEEIRSVPSLAYRNTDGGIVRNPLHPIVSKLDELPFFEHRPANAHILHERRIQPLGPELFQRYALYRGRTYMLLASRGCPYSCTYCCNNVFNDLNGSARVRRRSPENIVADIARALRDNPRITMVIFMDDCFLAARVDELRRFRDLYRSMVGVPFSVNSIPVYLTGDKLDILKEAGLSCVGIGMQSGSERVLKEIYKRKSLPYQVKSAADLCHERTIAYQIDIILDNPFETDEDSLLTIEALAALPKPYYLHLYSLTAYYGTDLHKKILEEAPDRLEESKVKNYFRFRRTPLNRLTFITPYIDRRAVAALVRLYRADPAGWAFRAGLALARVAAFLAMPVILGRVFVRIRGNSLRRAAGAFGASAGTFLRRFKEGLVSS